VTTLVLTSLMKHSPHARRVTYIFRYNVIHQREIMSFSERYGYKPIKEIIQIESMDEPLRNGLWSLLKVHCWDHVHRSSGIYGGYYLNDYGNEQIQSLCQRLWRGKRVKRRIKKVIMYPKNCRHAS